MTDQPRPLISGNTITGPRLTVGCTCCKVHSGAPVTVNVYNPTPEPVPASAEKVARQAAAVAL